MGSPFLFSIYVGIAVIALAIGGAFARPRGGRLVLLIFFLSSLLAVGGHTPLLRWLYDGGIATSIRYPEKFILMAVFTLIVFSSQMLDRMLDGDEDVRSGALGFVAASTLVAAVIALTGFTPLYPRIFNLLSKMSDLVSLRKVWGLTAGAAETNVMLLSRTDWIIAAARGIILIALLLTIRNRKRRVWLAVAAAFVTIDLLYVTYELNPREPRRFFDPPPAARAFPRNRQDFSIFHEADWYGTEKPRAEVFFDRRRRLLGRAQRPFSDDAQRIGTAHGSRARLRQDGAAAYGRPRRLRLGRQALRPQPTGGSRSWPCRTPGIARSIETSSARRSGTTATSRNRCPSASRKGRTIRATTSLTRSSPSATGRTSSNS